MQDGRAEATVDSCKKRLSAMCNDINSLPVEVLGNILSHVASARHVAMASATCQKWRAVMKHHLHRLTFDVSDFSHKGSSEDSNEETSWNNHEVVITEAVMQMRCLHDLSILYTGSACRAAIHAALVIAWLRHAKHTLKSLTLLSPIRPRLNILEKLAGGDGALERLVWGPAYIPTLSATIHSIPSLVSLTLNKMIGNLNIKDLHLLFSIFPKLEHLSLLNIPVIGVPSAVELHLPSSLKMLLMDKVSLLNTNLVVHARSLESFSVLNMRLESLDWVLGEGSMDLRSLVIRSSTIIRLVLHDSLRNLAVWDSHIFQLEHCMLTSLIDLKLIKGGGLLAAWPTFSRIVSKAGTKVSGLHLLGGYPGAPIIEANMIASSFPRLHTLSLDFQHTFFGESLHQPLIFKEVVVLELHTVMCFTDHEVFSEWIFKFLKCCPSLKKLAIVLEGPTHEFDDSHQFIGRLASILINRMHAYPHVDVKFQFDVSTK